MICKISLRGDVKAMKRKKMNRIEQEYILPKVLNKAKSSLNLACVKNSTECVETLESRVIN
jgi:hypothetical protein